MPTITIPMVNYTRALENLSPIQSKVTNNNFNIKKQKISPDEHSYDTRFETHKISKRPTNHSVSEKNNLVHEEDNRKQDTITNSQHPLKFFSLPSSPFIAQLIGQKKYHSTPKASSSATEAYNQSQNLTALYFYRIEPLQFVV